MRTKASAPAARGFRSLGVLILFLAGALVYAHPYLGVYASADPEFLAWLHGVGIILIFHSILLMAAHVFNRADAKEAVAIGAIFSCIYLFMAWRLFDSPEIVPIVSYREDQWILMEDSEFKGTLARIILGSVMVLIVLSILNNLKALFAVSAARRGR